ncbi:MAG: Asp-tRNA(Asn)/Glu-tRNA(Gln) amidotransferase GatCAB subunit B, partial [Bacteroidales bacterium]|nr:Asp-tRNA(Asn)/Glu-tRNA(Gln) amidotransferase GatCAB subunit B [Bacteroidales bacterium]
VQETRHFDEARGVTVSLRTKEEAHDYRYFPEADLVPIRVADWGPEIAKTLPELPDARRQRFISVYGIMDEHAKSLTSEKKVAEFYEEVAGQVDPKLAAVWTADVLKGELNYRDIGIEAFKTEDMVQLVSLLSKDKITEQSGIQVIRTILNEGGSPDKIIESDGLLKAEGDIVTTAVEEAISENPQPIADYLNGKPEALNFVVGQVMKKTKGRADAKSVRELILQKI